MAEREAGVELRPTVRAFAEMVERVLREHDYDRAQWRSEDGAAALCADLADLVAAVDRAGRRGAGPHMTPLRRGDLRERCAKTAAMAMAVLDCCGALDVPEGEE